MFSDDMHNQVWRQLEKAAKKDDFALFTQHLEDAMPAFCATIDDLRLLFYIGARMSKKHFMHALRYFEDWPSNPPDRFEYRTQAFLYAIDHSIPPRDIDKRNYMRKEFCRVMRIANPHSQGASMLKEFQAFIARGNVIDMAVGIIIGAAFTTIVASLVADIINPVIGLLIGGIDFSNLYLNLTATEYATLEEAKKAGAAVITYGVFINAVVKFLIVAFVVFLLVKNVNRLKDNLIKKEAEAPAAAPTPEDILLLREIRDALKK